MPSISTSVYVDVDLKDFDTDDLKRELSDRGHVVYQEDISFFDDVVLFAEVEARDHFVLKNPADLTQGDIATLLDVIERDCKIGSELYFIREKLIRARKYAKV